MWARGIRGNTTTSQCQPRVFWLAFFKVPYFICLFCFVFVFSTSTLAAEINSRLRKPKSILAACVSWQQFSHDAHGVLIWATKNWFQLHKLYTPAGTDFGLRNYYSVCSGFKNFFRGAHLQNRFELSVINCVVRRLRDFVRCVACLRHGKLVEINSWGARIDVNLGRGRENW